MHPYQDLPPSRFWRTGVADLNPLEINDLWQPKFDLTPTDPVVTAGSCFAQHIGKALQKSGYNWFDAEPAPVQADADLRKKYNYGIFSFRTGNIYTTSLLLQWCEWAFGEKPVPEEVWTRKDGRFVDPFRPNIEPEGFVSIDELKASREGTLAAIRRAVTTAEIFVFTLGLTEAWRNKKHDYLYAMCPGTVYGRFDDAEHEFVNFRYPEVRQAMISAIRLMKKFNPQLRFLLTVSPVPLTATASGEHVLTATTHSKSILRSVASDIASVREDTDYFPSYEIITGFPFRGMFFAPNMRSVSPKGVAFVMESFFQCLHSTSHSDSQESFTVGTAENADDLDVVVCEDALLETFGNGGSKPANMRANKKVCTLGSSHLGVVRQAWAEVALETEEDIQIRFFGAAGNGLNKVFVRDGIITSDDIKVQKSFTATSGGDASAQIGDYNCFVLYGIGFPLKAIQNHLEKLSATNEILNEKRAIEEVKTFASSFLKKTKSVTLAKAIRDYSSAPIHVAMTPLWSSLERDAHKDNYQLIRRFGPALLNIYFDTAREILACHNIQFVYQPEATIEDIYFTREEYIMGFSDGNIRDHGHMNKDYGHLMLHEILKHA